MPEFHDEIVTAIRRYQPDGVITFAEDGLYWHLDHIGVHERTYTAVRSLGADAPPLYYVTMPHGRDAARSSSRGRRGWTPPENGASGASSPMRSARRAKPPTFVVDVRDWVPRKLAALRCHRTQMGPDNPFARIDEGQARRLLGIEHFRRAPTDSRWESIIEQLGEPVPSP